jgi:hypothetical protein
MLITPINQSQIVQKKNDFDTFKTKMVEIYNNLPSAHIKAK